MSAIIIGLPQTMAKVAAIPAVAEVSGGAALEVGKGQLAVVARALAPKRTGALAASIVPVSEGVAALQEYGRYVEFGTVYMSAQPFMIDAAERAGPGIMREITEVIKRALEVL